MNQILEAQLLKRLTWMGWLLLFFAIVAIVYDFLPKVEEEILVLEEEAEPLNPYLVASVFTAVGSSCLVIAWKKRKNLN
jgi:hypothetical protein